MFETKKEKQQNKSDPVCFLILFFVISTLQLEEKQHCRKVINQIVIMFGSIVRNLQYHAIYYLKIF
jgi:hypothetical protein